MYWVIDRAVFRPTNVERLVAVLDRAELPYTLVTIDSKHRMTPDVQVVGERVFVCGAQRIAQVAALREWSPGSFLNENFDASIWVQHIPQHLLNSQPIFSTVGNLELPTTMFVRPILDTKLFDGQLFTPSAFADWRDANPQAKNIQVMAARPKEIHREYRIFVVKDQIVTGSLYRRAGAALTDESVDPEAIDFAMTVMKTWQPASAYVVDLALTNDGYRVIEFNNINSSGFYAADVARYVDAIERAYSTDC